MCVRLCYSIWLLPVGWSAVACCDCWRLDETGGPFRAVWKEGVEYVVGGSSFIEKFEGGNTSSELSSYVIFLSSKMATASTPSSVIPNLSMRLSWLLVLVHQEISWEYMAEYNTSVHPSIILRNAHTCIQKRELSYCTSQTHSLNKKRILAQKAYCLSLSALVFIKL